MWQSVKLNILKNILQKRHSRIGAALSDLYPTANQIEKVINWVVLYLGAIDT